VVATTDEPHVPGERSVETTAAAQSPVTVKMREFVDSASQVVILAKAKELGSQPGQSRSR